MVRNSGLLGLLLLIFACGESPETPQNGKIDVVCTTGMVADLARNIGGTRVSVTGLMGPGVDPHYYKASQGDIERLSRADLVLYNGLFLEGKMEGIFEKMGRTKTVVAVGVDVPHADLRRPEAFDGNFDPHIWFDVSLWLYAVDAVARTLAQIDTAGAVDYQNNASLYRRQLEELHVWVARQIEAIPQSRRVLVTAHDAFGYFGLAYGIEVIGLQGISTVAEYGVHDVSRLVDLIVSRRIKAIFVESSVSDRSIHAVGEGCRARGFEVAIGGTLYSDAMGVAGSGAETYVGMVRSNVKTIVAALR